MIELSNVIIVGVLGIFFLFSCCSCYFMGYTKGERKGFNEGQHLIQFLEQKN